MSYVALSEDDGVTRLTIDRPPANAMSVGLLGEIVSTLEQLATDPPRAVVLAGREGFFSAGVDLKAVPEYGATEQRQMVEGINGMVIAAYGLRCPLIGAITGHAIAGGMVLALCCDVRIASQVGRYGLTEVKVGVPFPQAAIMLTSAELAPHAARRMALGSALTDAADCLALGVFDEVVGPDAVISRATHVARELAALPGDVYWRTKHELRGDTLARMEAAAPTDPLLDAWVSA